MIEFMLVIGIPLIINVILIGVIFKLTKIADRFFLVVAIMLMMCYNIFVIELYRIIILLS